MWAATGESESDSNGVTRSTERSANIASTTQGAAIMSFRGDSSGRKSSGARTTTRKRTLGSAKTSTISRNGWATRSCTTANGPVDCRTNSPAGLRAPVGVMGFRTNSATTVQAKPIPAVIAPVRRSPSVINTTPSTASVSPRSARHASTIATQIQYRVQWLRTACNQAHVSAGSARISGWNGDRFARCRAGASAKPTSTTMEAPTRRWA